MKHNKTHKKPLRERIVAIATILSLVTSTALPLFSPLLTGRASADNGASNVLNMLYGQTNPAIPYVKWIDKNDHTDSWALKVGCDFHFPQHQRPLDNSVIVTALGPGFEKFDQWVGKSDDELKQHFFGVTPNTLNVFGDPSDSVSGTINETNGMNYLHYLRDHLNQPVNLIMSDTPEQTKGDTPLCGSIANNNSHFILVPVAGNGDDSTILLGAQVNVETISCGGGGGANNGTGCQRRGAVMIFNKTGLTADGNNTTGTLGYYNNDQRKWGLNNIVVGGKSGLTNNSGWGAAANATFQDMAHITITYNSAGAVYHETYTDFRWDGAYAYFLTATDEPSRQSLTLDSTGQDRNVDPKKNPGSNKVPFIWANFCGNSFKSNGYNLSADDNGNGKLSNAQVIQRIQQGIGNIGRCGGVDFYDYTAQGAINNGTPSGNGLPTPENLQPGGLTNSAIWFYTDGKQGLVSVFPTGDTNEALYTGIYGLNTATTNPVYYDHAGSCPYIGRLHTPGGPISADDPLIPMIWTLYRGDSPCQIPYGDLNVYALVDPAKYQSGSDLVNNTAPPAGTAEAQLVCDIAKISLSWLICPIAQAAISLAGSFDSAINDMLNISVDTFLNEKGNCADGNPGPCFYAAWNSMRVIAMAVIVAASLVMVISQALGLEVMSAYSIKKALPRLLMAVIFIALSWQLMKAAITFSDVLGYGVRALIYKPFSALGAAHIGAGTSDALAVLGGAAFIGLGALGLLSFAVTALLAVAVGFILLVFREMAVIFLTILTPAFVALSILPGTRKISKIGLDSISGALLMFPIVAGFIAIGHAFAQVANSVNNGNGNSGFGGVIGQFVFIIAYFAPYFLIPLAFRLAGGLVATVGGVVNDRSKGAFDRLKNFRANRLKTNMEKMGEGRRFSNNTRLGRAFNNTTEGATAFANSESKWGFLSNQGVRDAAFQQHRDMVGAKHAQSARAQATKENDLQHHAQTFLSEDEARAGLQARFGDMYDGSAAGQRNVESALAAARAAGGYGRARQTYALRRLAASGTGFANIEQMQRAVYAVAGNNREQASALLGELNAVAGNVGRAADLKAGYGTQMQLYDQMVATGGAVGPVEFARATVQAGRDADNIGIIRSKKNAVQNLGEATALVFRQNEVVRDSVGSTAQQVTDARQELDELSGMIGKVEQAYAYGSTTNVGVANATMGAPTSGAGTGVWDVDPVTGADVYIPAVGRRRILQDAHPAETQVNPTTDRLEPTLQIARYGSEDPADPDYDDRVGRTVFRADGSPYVIGAGDEIFDPHGNAQYVIDPDTRRPVMNENPTASAVSRRSYENSRVYGPQNPGDPIHGGTIQ